MLLGETAFFDILNIIWKLSDRILFSFKHRLEDLRFRVIASDCLFVRHGLCTNNYIFDVGTLQEFILGHETD